MSSSGGNNNNNNDNGNNHNNRHHHHGACGGAVRCVDEVNHDGCEHGVPEAVASISASNAGGGVGVSSLYDKVNIDAVVCLNESVAESARLIFKPWDRRLDDAVYVESDVDDQLLLHIPFSGQVKLNALSIRTTRDSRTPRELRIFINADAGMDFATAEGMHLTARTSHVIQMLKPDDEPADEVTRFSLSPAKFSAVRSLTVFIPGAQLRDTGDRRSPTTAVAYLGFHGQFTQLWRDPVITLYEAAANPGDHVKIQGTQSSTGMFGYTNWNTGGGNGGE